MSDGEYQNSDDIYRAIVQLPSEKGLKFDQDKTDYSLIPPEFLKGIADVLTFGAKKYGKGNWKKFNEDDKDRLYSALMRHVEAVRANQTIDPETRLKHLYHAGCNLLMWDYLNDK